MRTRGLTLIELMAVIAVIAVLASLAVPSIAQALGAKRLAAAAETLAADLSEARFEAARRGQPYFVTAGSDAEGWCWSVARQPACPCGQLAECQLKTSRAADHAGVRLEDGLMAQLDPDGSAQGALSATFVGRDNQRLRVEIGRMGRARICRVEDAPASSAGLRYPAC